MRNSHFACNCAQKRDCAQMSLCGNDLALVRSSFPREKRKLFMTVRLDIIEKLIRTEPLTHELPANITDWPEDWREEFEERAAIMGGEFYGSLSRPEAEAWAETIIRALYRLQQKGIRDD